MLKKEFEFILEDTLTYSHDGKAGISAKKLLLRAPSCKLLYVANQLSSMVMNALMKARGNYTSDSNDNSSSSGPLKIDGESVYMIISSSFNDKKQMDDFSKAFEDLILSDNICLIDGKEPLTQDLLADLDAREFLRLTGDYIANFLLPSIMNQSTKKK